MQKDTIRMEQLSGIADLAILHCTSGSPAVHLKESEAARLRRASLARVERLLLGRCADETFQGNFELSVKPPDHFQR